jgi:formiminotetrahydrofolate cyclodeaminase
LSLADSSLWSLTTAQLRDHVASVKPTPGGGSVSIVTATLGLALVHKGVSVSLKRSASDPIRHRKLVDLNAKLTALTNTLSAFADADSSAFESYMQARSLPHATDLEAIARNAAMQTGLLRSTEVPLESAAAMVQGLSVAEEVVELADGYVLSDILSGSLLLHASVNAVLLSADANLDGIADAEQREMMSDLRVDLECEAALRMEAVDRKFSQP